MDFEQARHARVSVKQALAEFTKHDVKANIINYGPGRIFIRVEDVYVLNGEECRDYVEFNVDSHGMVSAMRILRFLGY